MNKYVKLYGRKIDYYASLEDPKKSVLVFEELKKYQNIDGGFGHGLEIDIQAPISNMPSTDVAIKYINKLPPSNELELMIDGMIRYYEAMFNPEEHRWYMVEQEVDQYPRAIWWNYEGRTSFGVLNPTPEILGFLYLHKDKVKTINLENEISLMVERIKQQLSLSKGFHDVLSVLRFYRDVPYIRHDIYDVLYRKTQEFLKNQEGDYYLRAHQVALISSEFVLEDQLKKDIEKLKEELEKNGYIMCPWQWYQYEEDFKRVKPYWNAFLTTEAMEAINKYEEEN